MTDERLKELVPDVDKEDFFGANIWDEDQIQQQTENLKKAVKALIEICDDLNESCGGRGQIEDIYNPLLEQITGTKYEEIGE
jgi:hypothetical protein